MANYSEYPDYSSAFNKVQKLNFELNGAPESLATGAAGSLAEIRNNPKFGPNSKEYKTAKARFDSTQKQLAEAQSALAIIKQRIDTENSKVTTAKIKTKDVNTAKADVTVLTEQLAQQKEINALPDVIAKTQADLLAAQNKAAGKTTGVDFNAIGAKLGDTNTNPNGTTKTGDPLLDNFTAYRDPADGISKVSGAAKDAQGNPVTGEFFLVPPAKPGDKPTMINDSNKAMDLMISAAGGTDKLAASLTSAGYTQDFRTNLIAAIRRYSTDTLDAYQSSKGKLAITGMDSFFKELSTVGAGTTKTRVDQALTDRGGSDRYIDSYFTSAVGRAATKEEKNAFYNQLNKLEGSARIATTTTTDAGGAAKNVSSIGSNITDADRTVLAASIASKTLSNTPVDALMKSAKPGQIVTDINTLMSAASDYGIVMTPQDALRRLSSGLGQTDYVAKQKDVLKQLAITTMPNLAAHIQAGGTVKDVADLYANVKTRKLGVTIPDSTADNEIMSVINAKGGMVNMNDYERQLQADPRWRTTAEAHKVADDFTNTILQSFGFGGN